jgi:hypothetical protein
MYQEDRMNTDQSNGTPSVLEKQLMFLVNMKDVLALKRMVLDLNHMVNWTWQNGRHLSEDEGRLALEQAMDRVRATVECVTGCNDIPLECYEWNDEAFVYRIADSLNKKK